MSSTSHTSVPATEFLQFIDKTLITNPRFFYKTYQGYAFSVSHRFEDVAADSSVYLYFENPAASGRQVFLVAIEVITTGQARVDVYRDNTVNVAGTSLTPINLNFESAINSIVNAEYGGTYTEGDLTVNAAAPGGTKVRAIGSATEIGETAIIPSDFNFLVKVTNKSAGAADISMRIIWWEEAT